MPKGQPGAFRRIPRPKPKRPATLGAVLLRLWMQKEEVYTAELGRQLKIARTWVAELLRGRWSPSLRLAQQIEKLTDKSVTVNSWLLPYEGDIEKVDYPVHPKGRPHHTDRLLRLKKSSSKK